MTPLKAIRAKCLDCMGGNKSYVKDCIDEKCPLYPYRKGTCEPLGSSTRGVSGKTAVRLPN